MHENIKRIITTVAVTAIIGSVLAGCKATPKTLPKVNNTIPAAVSYPIKTDKVLTYWAYMNTATPGAGFGNDYGNLPMYKELQKETGVTIKFIHPAIGQEVEQFNLLLASGDLPDMIEYNWMSYPGGPEKAISDKVITPLNDIMNKETPNLKKVLAKDVGLNKMVKTDTDKYYVFPFSRGSNEDKSLLVFDGLTIRKDWLDKLGLKVPTTIDEWHTVLTAFKTKLNVQSPFCMWDYMNQMKVMPVFVGAFGTYEDFFLDDKGKVQFGPIQPGYKDYIATMAQWYKEGLIDKDWATNNRKAVDAKVLASKTGATYGGNGSSLGKYIDTMKKDDPTFNLVGAPYPTLKAGDKPEFGHLAYQYSGGTGSVAISATSSNKDLAAEWLDYAYGSKGHMLFNFGIEGQSYTMVDGKPKYTDLIMNNPNKIPVASIMAAYTRSSFNGPFVQDPNYFTQYTANPVQQEAVKIWGNTNEAKHLLPPVTPSPTESTQMSTIMNDVTTYRTEMLTRFILGQEPMSNYDAYVAQIKKMGIDTAIKINQSALDRYNKRK